MTVMQKTVLVGVAAFGAGYLVAVQQLKKKYEDFAMAEIDEARLYYREHYADLVKAEPIPEPENFAAIPEQSEPAKVEASEDLLVAAQALVNYQGLSSKPVAETKPQAVAQMAKGMPHVISTADYMDPERDIEQTSLTYYATDDVLALGDVKIDNQVATLGANFQSEFGNDSDDDDTVYIHNPEYQMDYEVTREYGSYAEEVLGLGDDE